MKHQGFKYRGADFCASIPHTDRSDITSHQNLTATLLPVKYKASTPIASLKVCQGPERSEKLDILRRFVVAEEFDNSIRRSCHEERLVVLIDEPDLGDSRLGRISIRKSVEPG
jgi:hypothetical protein